jgi:hypothetical protein
MIGAPNFAPSPAMRRSQAQAISSPPPTQGAEDRGHRRMRAGLDGGQRRAHRLVIGQRAVDVGARGLELLEVAAGGEGHALAAQDHAAQRLVGGKPGEGLAQPRPHARVERVELVRVEQGYGGGGGIAFKKDVGFHGHSRSGTGFKPSFRRMPELRNCCTSRRPVVKHRRQASGARKVK